MLEHQSSTSTGSRQKQQGSVQSKRNMFATNSELKMFRATEEYDANSGEKPVWERPPRSPTQMELTSSFLLSCRLASKQIQYLTHWNRTLLVQMEDLVSGYEGRKPTLKDVLIQTMSAEINTWRGALIELQTYQHTLKQIAIWR